MAGIQIQTGDTLWGIAKKSVQAQNGEGQKVTNQQIVDEMNRIAKDSGYKNVDECVKDNFYSKDGEFGSLNVKGLEIEHSEKTPTEKTPTEETSTEETPTEDVPNREQALKSTTLGAAGTFATKTALKVGSDVVKNPNVKNATKKAAAKTADATKKAATKLKGKVDAAKVKHARNGQAAKIRDARKAAEASRTASNTLKAEQAKLRSLKANNASKAAIEAQEKVVEKAMANKTKAAGILKAKRGTAGLNKRTGQLLKNKKIVKTPAGKVAKTAAKKVAKKAATKTAAKAAAKNAGKTLLKKIPGVGLLVGIAFAADRAAHGDLTGAAGEVLSGAASCIPGVGTAVSTAIDAGLMYKDIKNA